VKIACRRGGFGRAQPSQEKPIFILSLCGAAAWTAEVNIARPREGLGGRSPPKNNNIFILALCAPRMGPNVKIGNPGFPPLLFIGMPGAPNGGWGMGKPGFPIPLPEGREWEGCALEGTRPGFQATSTAVGGWGNRVSPRPSLWGGSGRRGAAPPRLYALRRRRYASKAPPSAVTPTTSQEGAFQTWSNPKAARASATS